MTKTAAKIVIIDKDFAGQRLDNYLFREFRKLPKSRVYKMLRKGEVRVNGSRKKQAYRIQQGDKVRLPPVQESDLQQDPSQLHISDGVKRRLDESILYEDDDLLVLDKPARMPVHAGSGFDFGIIEALRAMRPESSFLELAHRLDRETSGCLLLAKNRDSLSALHRLLRESAMVKHYRVLIAGRWQGGARQVDSSLLRTGDQGKIRHTREDEQGKEARSLFTPLEIFDDASLMDVQIFTGRTHQIRVQSAELGHPVLGDDKYGDFALNRVWKKRGLKRLFLHSYESRFRLAEQGDEYHFVAPLAADLQAVLDGLRGQESS